MPPPQLLPSPPICLRTGHNGRFRTQSSDAVATVPILEPGRTGLAPTFEQPLHMLQACHERVLRMCTLLERLQEHAATKGADDQARQAARDILRYFDLAGPHHHEDEERHLFPRMLASGDERQVQLAEKLHQQHLDMAALWQALRKELEQMEGGNAEPLLKSAVTAPFLSAYREHIDCEEEQAYPLAFQDASEEQQRAWGEEMAQRRISQPKLG